MAFVVNPHLLLYLKGTEQADDSALPPRTEQLQELRREYDLGAYDLEALVGLFDILDKRIKKWVAGNAPEGG